MLQFYLPLLYLHVALAITSPLLFSVRALRAAFGQNPAAGWLRVAPHAVDALLFAAGVTLALMLRQYPLVHPWLTAKILALLLYIVLGHLAVRRARARSLKLALWLAALAVLFYIYGVAFTKSPTVALG